MSFYSFLNLFFFGFTSPGETNQTKRAFIYLILFFQEEEENKIKQV